MGNNETTPLRPDSLLGDSTYSLTVVSGTKEDVNQARKWDEIQMIHPTFTHGVGKTPRKSSTFQQVYLYQAQDECSTTTTPGWLWRIDLNVSVIVGLISVTREKRCNFS